MMFVMHISLNFRPHEINRVEMSFTFYTGRVKEKFELKNVYIYICVCVGQRKII